MADSFTLAKRIAGQVSGTSLDLVMEKMRDALGEIYDQVDWSFQRGITYANWLVPGLVASKGNTAVTPYSNQVIANDAATAAINSYLATSGAVFITTLQYRDPEYSIYNIIGYDDGQTPGQGNYPYATITLDRPWMEPTSGPGQDYMLYQAYFVAPVKDFRKFIEVRDTSDGFALDFWSMTQADLAERDAQRLIFSDPTCVVAAGVDTRPGTSTPGWPMFELWPQQLSYEPYSFSYRRRGPIPEEEMDFMGFEVPYPLTNELLEYKTKDLLYEFKEAQRDKTEARGAGSNWLLLQQMALKRYAGVLDKIIPIDLNLNNEAISQTSSRNQGISGEPYANRRGGVNMGSY